MKTILQKMYQTLKQIPVLGKFIQYSGDIINMPRKSRLTLNELRVLSQANAEQWAVLQQNLTPTVTKPEASDEESISQLLQKTAYYQPLYGYQALPNEEPQRPCLDRADMIYQALQPMGPTRILDTGCSFGYFSYYLAARNFIVDAIDFDNHCIEMCHFLTKFNTVNIPSFAQAALDLNYIQNIPEEKYDIVLLLSILHHITSEHGIEYVQEMMCELLKRVPILILELALSKEEVTFPWKDRLPSNELAIFEKCQDIEIIKLGYCSTHLSTLKRPLYMVRKKTVTVKDHTYQITNRRFTAHEDAHYYFRTFYTTDNAFIKNYRLQHNELLFNDSKQQILNEIALYQKLPRAPYFCELIDYEVNETTIKIVLSKLPGQTLRTYIENNIEKLDATMIIQKLLAAVKVLREIGLYHNDIRSWNIMSDNENVFLYDFGLASTIETENTITSILWIIYALHYQYSIDYLEMAYPLSTAPQIALEELSPELRRITVALLQSKSIDAYFANAAIAA